MAGYDSKGDGDAKALRNLRKKLAQIAAIEEKSSVEGLDLSEEQLEKVGRKAELETELQRLLEPPLEPVPEPSTAAPSDESEVVTEQTSEPSSAPSGLLSAVLSAVSSTLPPAEEASADAADAAGQATPFSVNSKEFVPKPRRATAEQVQNSATVTPDPAPNADWRSREVKKKPGPAIQAPAVSQEPAFVAPASESASASADARIRSVKKKLAQIETLEEKCADGRILTEEQAEKLARKAELETELANLLAPSTKPSPKVDTAKFSPKLPISKPGLALDGETASGVVTPARMSPSLRSMSFAMRSPSGNPRQSPSMRWQEDPIAVEDIAPAEEKMKDARFVVTKDKVIVFKSCEDSEQIRSLKKGDAVLADGDVRVVDGYEMLPIQPRGAVEFAHLLREEPLFEIIENVQPYIAATQSNERLKAIMKEVAELSHDAFEEDALHMVTKKGGWKMTLMATPAGRQDEDTIPLRGFMLDAAPCPSLIGFLIYRLRPDLESLSIAKLAIVPEHRQRGHGRRFIEWCVQSAKKNPAISFISLSSLPEAVKFYQRLGFRDVDVKLDKVCGNQCGPDEDLVEGQVYMEYRIKGRGGRGKKKGR